MDKTTYHFKDIIAFRTNQPQAHVMEMFGHQPFDPNDIEKEEYVGWIKTVISDKEYLIYGEAPITSVTDTLGITLPWDDRLKTIGGLITKKMARIPFAGEKVTLGKYTFTIEEASDRQVLKVRFKK